MTDATGSTGGEGYSVTELPADAPESFSSPTEAAAYFTTLKEKQAQELPAESAEAGKPATANKESTSQEADSDPETDPAEETTEADPAELPPIERPRSWAKELDEEWASYPRAAQEKIAKREQERDAAIRRSQNEAAEIRKAAEAERDQAKQVRTEYEGKLPALMDAIHQASPFADVKTMADVEKMQAEDPFRFQQFQVYQWKMAGVQQELQQAKQRQTAEVQTKFTDFVKAESAALNEKMPEFADKDKGPELSKKLVEYLRSDVGLTDQELGSYSSGEKISPLDHRLQIMAVKAMRYDELQKAPAKAIPKPVPPVQRPGTSKPAGSVVSEKIQALEARFNKTGDIKDATALYAAQMEAQSRRRAS